MSMVYTPTVATAQLWLNTHTYVASGSAPDGDISSTCYEHTSTCWGFSCVKQSIPEMCVCVCVLIIPVHVAHYQAYYTAKVIA